MARRQLVLVHGRSQQNKDAAALKAEWLESLSEGMAKSGLKLPINETDVRFPYYGDTLIQMTDGMSEDEAADVIVKGSPSLEENAFVRDVLEQVREVVSITTDELEEVEGQIAIAKGPANWEWFQGIVRAIDRFVPFGSGGAVAVATRDVYQYLMNSAIRQEIDTGVRNAFTPGVETVVVGHSLGSVVAYNLLRQQGHLLGWRVPLLITVGSPLAITVVRNTLRRFAPLRCPECVAGWLNAMDERDIVALYPLEGRRFPLNPDRPEIENKRDVRNRTANRHGIAGYLDDELVARRIHDALVE